MTERKLPIKETGQEPGLFRKQVLILLIDHLVLRDVEVLVVCLVLCVLCCGSSSMKQHCSE